MNAGRHFLSGDEAVAVGVTLAKPNVIAAYPITPQTIVVERLSDYVENGLLKCEYVHVESEHSALVACMGASAVGARTFTATSSQGLLYMCEGLHYASGARMPIVMMNANRSIAAPWSIFGDQRDSFSQLNCGWIQVYVENAQEALDMTIQAFKLAEDSNVMTPVMVNLDGFVLTHTYEVVNVPNAELVDAFLPQYVTTNKMDLDNPTNMCFSTSPSWNTEFRYLQQTAIVAAIDKIKEIDCEYGEKFGRSYGGMVEEYLCEDAQVVLITVGSVAGTAKTVAAEMRKEGLPVGVLRIRYLRPFPEAEIRTLGEKAKVIGVLEKDISFGYEGTVFTNVNSTLAQLNEPPKSLNFIAGLGGRDISKKEVRQYFDQLLHAAEGQSYERVQFPQLNHK